MVTPPRMCEQHHSASLHGQFSHQRPRRDSGSFASTSSRTTTTQVRRPLSLEQMREYHSARFDKATTMNLSIPSRRREYHSNAWLSEREISRKSNMSPNSRTTTTKVELVERGPPNTITCSSRERRLSERHSSERREGGQRRRRRSSTATEISEITSPIF